MMEIKNMMENADFILHISSFFGTSPGGIVPNKKIPSAIWHGGSYFRNQFKMFIRDIHRRYKMVFAHRDLETLGKNIKRLQAPIDTDNFEYQKRDWNGTITIGHSPSDRGVKGTHFFEEAIPILRNKFGNKINFSLYEGDWKAVMRKKRGWHIYFDQINREYELNGATHGYGVALIESACYGSICMCGSKYSDTPIITVRNAADIVKKVTNLMNHRDRLEKLSIKTREWVVKEHGYETIGNYFIDHIRKYGEQDLWPQIYNVFNNYKASKRKDIICGRVRVFDFTRGEIKNGYINVPFIRDFIPLQYKYAGISYSDKKKIDMVKASRSHTFITLNDEMEELIKDYYFQNGIKEKPFIFKVFPSRKDVPYKKKKRKEIVFIDNSVCSYTNYYSLISFMDNIAKNNNIKALFISRNFHNEARTIASGYDVKVLPLNKYDYGSKYGLRYMAQCPEYSKFSIGRKVLIYIAAGMIPVIDSKYRSLFKYMESENINYIQYNDVPIITGKDTISHDPEEFTMEKQQHKLIEYLKKVDERYEDS